MAFPFFTLQAEAQQLDEATAANLARLPIHCIPNEYPNKTGHMAETETDAKYLHRTNYIHRFMDAWIGTAAFMATGCW